MKRRAFLKTTAVSGLSIAAIPTVIVKLPKTNHLDRIGITTVVFRNRFASTAAKGSTIENELILNEVPTFFADRFGIHNVELWSRHFESKSPGYIKDIKKSLKQNKSTLIDIQVDTKNDLSDPNDENRRKAIAEMKEWIEVGKALGSTFIRISPMHRSYNQAVKSIREINEFAKEKGIKALVENHNDMFSKVENHLNIRKDITDENLGLLADFGNYPNNTDQYVALQKIAPYTKLISAKTKDFSEDMKHLSFDFGKCVEIFEKVGFQGVYSLEQWGKPNPEYDYEQITDWMIEEVKGRIG